MDFLKEFKPYSITDPREKFEYKQAKTFFTFSRDVSEFAIKNWKLKEFDLHADLKFCPKSQHISEGGIGVWNIPFICVSVYRFRKVTIENENNLKFDFPEYRHIKNDSEIGAIHGQHWSVALKAEVTHEIAHSVAYRLYETPIKPHGGEWQEIYRKLRKRFINPLLTPP